MTGTMRRRFVRLAGGVVAIGLLLSIAVAASRDREETLLVWA